MASFVMVIVDGLLVVWIMNLSCVRALVRWYVPVRTSWALPMCQLIDLA